MRRKQGKLLTPSSLVGQSLFLTPNFDYFLTPNFIGRLLSKIVLYLLAPTLILTLIFMGRVLSAIGGNEFTYVFNEHKSC
jgi:hypothetical protein